MALLPSVRTMNLVQWEPHHPGPPDSGPSPAWPPRGCLGPGPIAQASGWVSNMDLETWRLLGEHWSYTLCNWGPQGLYRDRNRTQPSHSGMGPSLTGDPRGSIGEDQWAEAMHQVTLGRPRRPRAPISSCIKIVLHRTILSIKQICTPICSYENTWNGNEDSRPHTVFHVKVRRSSFIIAKHCTPPRCPLHWRMSEGRGVPTRCPHSSAVKGTHVMRPKPCAHLRSITVRGRARLAGCVCATPHTGAWRHASHVGVTFHKVTADTDFANAGPLLPGEYRVRSLPASGHGIFTTWSVHNFATCVFLVKDTLSNIADSLALTSRPMAL